MPKLASSMTVADPAGPQIISFMQALRACCIEGCFGRAREREREREREKARERPRERQIKSARAQEDGRVPDLCTYHTPVTRNSATIADVAIGALVPADGWTWWRDAQLASTVR